MTVSLIAEGIKKLRARHAEGGRGTEGVQLWRGMRNLAITDGFMQAFRTSPELQTRPEISYSQRPYGVL